MPATKVFLGRTVEKILAVKIVYQMSLTNLSVLKTFGHQKTE
jgi:hypothetical protein